MPNRLVRLTPSILNCDFSRLGEQIRDAEAAGVDGFHLDVMDGRYVPNISFGPSIVKAVRSLTKLPLDIHLMVEEPDRFLADFADAGADILTVHAEACRHLHRTVTHIRNDLHLLPGVALNPGTGLNAIAEVLGDLRWVTVMSVNPGWGGQSFIESVLPKLTRLREQVDRERLPIDLCVDGGVKESNAAQVAAAGASVLVSGTGVYRPDMPVRDAVARLRAAIAGGE
ncbi:MAG: ribulose-phosphate 3-epimerase [Chloroflexi bacterium]|nr:ribulose-phosphate 3-epimerase [Chloroflexota bacterium]